MQFTLHVVFRRVFRPDARIAWLGGGGTKNLILRIREGGPKKVFISKYARIFTNSGVKAKKALRLKKCANFHELRGETAKKGSLLQNLQKKTVLAHEVWGDNQYLGSLRPRTALQWHQACYFLWGTILAWGAQFLFGWYMQ